MERQNDGYDPSKDGPGAVQETITPEQQAPKEQEENELKKLSPIFLVYRDNELFGKYINSISKTLGTLGHQVEIHNFPPETDLEKIKQWAQASGSQVEGKVLITDRTCSIFGADAKPVDNKESYLDTIFEKASMQVILGDNSDQKIKEGGSKALEPSYKKILSRVISRTKPEKVLILEKSLRDHQFSDILERLMSEALTKEEIKTYKDLKWNFDQTEEQKKAFLGIEKKIRTLNLGQKASEEASHLIKSWLVDTGVPEESVSIVESTWDIPDDFDQTDNWIIADRHAFPHRNKREDNKAIILNLPLADFIETTKKEGLLEFEPDELEIAVNEILEKDFGHKE